MDAYQSNQILEMAQNETSNYAGGNTHARPHNYAGGHGFFRPLTVWRKKTHIFPPAKMAENIW